MVDSSKKQFVNGVIYTALSKYMGVIMTLVISAILARLISPSDFGIAAVATVLITFFGIFSNFGIGPAIIQKSALTKSDLDSIFTFTIYLGIFISLIFFFSSNIIAAYYEKEILVNICRLLSINLFFASVNIVPNALLLRAKKFKIIAYRTIILQLIGGIFSIWAAYAGWGVYALLINPIFSSIGLFVFNYIQYPQKIVFKIKWQSLKIIASFSIYQFLFNFINYFSRNLDKLLIGKYLNMDLLGYYDKSYRLMILPIQNLTHIITPVMHPVFADFQDDLKRLSSSYMKVIHLLALIGFPLSIFLFFSARELILLVFGDQWDAAVPVFKILSFSVGIQVVLSTSGSIFQASNSTKYLFTTGLVAAILNIIGLCIGLFYFESLNAIAWAFDITFFTNFLIIYYVMFKSVFNQSIKIFAREFVSPLILTGLISVSLYIANICLDDTLLLVSFIAKASVFGIVMLCYIQLKKEYDLIGLLKKYVKKYFNK